MLAAIDVDTKECLTVWPLKVEEALKLTFLKEVLKHENKPEVVVDRGFWYRCPLQRLGLKYRHETFGKRNAVEGFFSRFKERRSFGTDFLSSFDSVQNWLESFVAFYNYWRCLS